MTLCTPQAALWSRAAALPAELTVLHPPEALRQLWQNCLPTGRAGAVAGWRFRPAHRASSLVLPSTAASGFAVSEKPLR